MRSAVDYNCMLQELLARCRTLLHCTATPPRSCTHFSNAPPCFRCRRSSLDDGHLRAGRQLLARCRPSGGSTYDVDLAVAPRYATLNTWAQISYRMPQAVALPNGAACTDVGSFALQVSEGPHFTLQRINLGNPFEGFAVRNPVDGCEVAANGSAKHRAGASNKIHPSGDADGGKGQSAGGSAMWELRLASNSKVGLPTRVSDSDVRSHSSGNAAGRFDSRRVLAEVGSARCWFCLTILVARWRLWLQTSALPRVYTCVISCADSWRRAAALRRASTCFCAQLHPSIRHAVPCGMPV